VLSQFPKPENLEEMVKVWYRLLDKVGNPPFVRIDLYNFGNRTFFGEYTHSPGKGDKKFLPRDESEPKNKYEVKFGRSIIEELTVVCFKWEYTTGKKLPAVDRIGGYKAEYVNKLYRSFQKHLQTPHRFVCVTDKPEGIACETFPLWDWYRELGGCYTRLKMFDPEMRKYFGKRVVMIDIDTVVTGNLDNMFNRKEDFIIHTYYPDSHGYQQKYNGSLIMMDMGCRPQVYEQFKGKESDTLIQGLFAKKKIIGSDQAWINYVLGDGEARFGEADGIYHLRNIMIPKKETRRKVGQLPKNTNMVMFSGNQDPSMITYKKFNWVTANWV
jgi:hypothetical protein